MTMLQTYETPSVSASLPPPTDACASTDACAEGILDAIGKTPLIRLRHYLDHPQVDLLVKLEAANPGGSAKDRPARQMIEQALQRGRIDQSSTIVESSSGNMGIGLAQVCRYHGLRFHCVVDPNAQAQNVAIMRALGAEIDRVDQPVNGDFLTARLQRVQHLLDALPGAYWPNQYANKANPRSHFLGTIQEIDAALDGQIDYLFVATSSTGTARGCRDYLRRRGRHTRVVAVDAVGSVLFGGTAGRRFIPGLGAGRVPHLARNQHFDQVCRVSDLDCVVGCRRAAQREAVLVGGSAGGVLETIRRQQDELVGKTCVAILHDSGTRYLETVFDDQWVQQRLDCSAAELQRRVAEPTGSPSFAEDNQ
ncbi:2,3-diaminopropionate biosynthesis protein SbnA [Roseimaritima sediminicola]|uniref:2,3-diaminopropionate biosynthesis protein SbnA n=1 Tax=Roseimaritima sediminicola TaxID=2662066 RepID=UPI001EEEAB01|nr:2,3-diaminopropionate biosynthesis protein SbnA [Roseimaritima sediminicola]